MDGAHPDATRLIWAKGLRAIGDGYVSILLPVYLLALGYSPFDIGILATTALLGSSVCTLLAGGAVARFGYRHSLQD